MTTVHAEEPIEDWWFITIVAATLIGIVFGLRTLGIGQYSALLTSVFLVWLDALYDD